MIAELYGRLLQTPQEPRSWWQVIVWWELRRIPYNLIVGTVGIVSLVFYFIFIHLSGELKPGEDAVEPIALMAAPFVINIAYTAGWTVELFLRSVWRNRLPTLAPLLLKLGLSISLLFAILPALIWCFIWIIRTV